MTLPDYRGARGSNAGDDFHELWSLRQCLQLLDPDTELRAVTVEGLRAEDEAGVSADTWDGVDSTLYFGGPDIRSATRIVIQQFKYSSANPDLPWTASRLTRATNRSKDNSVFARFAKAFDRLSKLRPDLIARGDLLIRLVSNQPLDPALERALSPSPSQDAREQDLRRECSRASGLNEAHFAALLAALDLSHCGTGSRFQIENRVLTALSTLVEDDARASAAVLVGFIHKKMLPEAKGEFITKQDVLVQFGFSDPAGLFPCPSETKRLDTPVRRQAADLVAQLLLEGKQYLCVHGEGGCGKTTLLQQVQAQLPPGSVTVLFDCFGGGRYLDSDAYRHRPQDAFVQVCNDLARLLRTPHLVTSSPNLEYPRVFKKRLQVASDLVRSKDPAALVLIVIDAADNSVTAAQSRTPPGPSFVHDFVRVAALPSNVRFVLTARTGRLESLQLPAHFVPFCLHGFTREETGSLIRVRWPEVPDTWIDDFQALSQGNPRVQQYALDYAGSDPQRALDYLRPDKGTLEAVFEERYTFAARKAGQDATLKTFCSGLAALPRPIPLEELAAVTQFSKEYITDICSDLTLLCHA